MLNQLARFAPVAERRRPARADGCWTSERAARGSPVAARGWSVTALDSVWNDYGNARGDGTGPATAVTGDARSLPFPDGPRSTRSSASTSSSTSRPGIADAYSEELRRVCAGRLLVACPTGALALEADSAARAALSRSRGRAARLARRAPQPWSARVGGASGRGRARRPGRAAGPRVDPRAPAARAHGEQVRRGGLAWRPRADCWPPRFPRDARGTPAARSSGRCADVDREPTYRTMVVVDVA